MRTEPTPRTGSSRHLSGRQWLVLLLAIVIAATCSVVFFIFPRVKQSPPADAPVTSLQAPDAFYMPAEFQPQEYLLLGGSQLAELHPDVLVAVVRAAAPAIDILVLVGSTETGSLVRTILMDNGLPEDSADIVVLPILTMWVRDFGPVTVSDAAGRRSMVKFHYRERRGNRLDNGVADHIAVRLDLNLMSSPLLAEGGDYLSNGRGLCLLSTRVINRNAHYLEMEPRQTMANLAAMLGFETLNMVRPLQGESTGHADIFCAFLRPDLLVVGSCDPADDPQNAARLDETADQLRGAPTLDGPLQVLRIPMPDHHDGVWRTYTNIVFANEVLLVPVYPDYCPGLDRSALEFYRRLLPDRQVVGIDCSRLIRMNGALRCITMNVPRGLPLAAPAGSGLPGN